jgi:hypothetical protein
MCHKCARSPHAPENCGAGLEQGTCSKHARTGNAFNESHKPTSQMRKKVGPLKLLFGGIRHMKFLKKIKIANAF